MFKQTRVVFFLKLLVIWFCSFSVLSDESEYTRENAFDYLTSLPNVYIATKVGGVFYFSEIEDVVNGYVEHKEAFNKTLESQFENDYQKFLILRRYKRDEDPGRIISVFQETSHGFGLAELGKTYLIFCTLTAVNLLYAKILLSMIAGFLK